MINTLESIPQEESPGQQISSNENISPQKVHVPHNHRYKENKEVTKIVKSYLRSTAYDCPSTEGIPFPIKELNFSNQASLGPWITVPEKYKAMRDWRILIVCTAVNSMTQQFHCLLSMLKFNSVSIQMATNEKDVVAAVETWKPQLVIGTFLTMKVPESVFKNVLTLIVHPGPPGDVGPSSLDWALMGDDGSLPSTDALNHLMTGSLVHNDIRPRQKWGCVVFQANEELDAGAVWAWEHYDLPVIGSITKSQLYQSYHRPAAVKALIKAMCRIFRQSREMGGLKQMEFPEAKLKWHDISVSGSILPEKLCDRPILRPKDRKIDFALITAIDAKRIIASADSQPGAQLSPPTTDSTTAILIYGAHVELSPPPFSIWSSLGVHYWEDVPAGRIIASRDGALCFKTKSCSKSGCAECGVAVWVEMGRVPKKAGQPLEPKIPLKLAIQRSGHGAFLKGVGDWPQYMMYQVPGTYQEIYIDSVSLQDRSIVQFVHFNFYNGAMSTTKCHNLLRMLQWCTHPSRGNVRALVLMGGLTCFSNGIDLCTIEAAYSPGEETMRNIIAMDDVCEFLLSDVLAERGIMTMACLKGNAGAGGVALATNCSFVIGSKTAVFNPGYKGIGLTGAENHTFTYNHRTGDTMAERLLTDLIPMSASQSQAIGLIDHSTGTFDMTPLQIDITMKSLCLAILNSTISSPIASSITPAPWARPSRSSPPSKDISLTTAYTQSQIKYMSNIPIPIAHLRHIEEEEMTIDSFDPLRSKRYHPRRYAFVRKVKATSTPLRYAHHLSNGEKDIESTPQFDLTFPDYLKGCYWTLAGLKIPRDLIKDQRSLSHFTRSENSSSNGDEANISGTTAFTETDYIINEDVGKQEKSPTKPNKDIILSSSLSRSKTIQSPTEIPTLTTAVVKGINNPKDKSMISNNDGMNGKDQNKIISKEGGNHLSPSIPMENASIRSRSSQGKMSRFLTMLKRGNGEQYRQIEKESKKEEPMIKRMFGSSTRRPQTSYVKQQSPLITGAVFVPPTVKQPSNQNSEELPSLTVEKASIENQPVKNDQVIKPQRPVTAGQMTIGKNAGRRLKTGNHYTLPEVPNADIIDFPCIYNPAPEENEGNGREEEGQTGRAY
ncbi:hypothetical protein M231_04680 [Tremella mesenterica]|uniref:Formyl transferase C-terminal domain-containing protein n=1 Tax=Tremella mesenterica TaxID=5217 RepID=A0A4Q1BJU2_TREME|nr:hypothetical protein M231_04680 [Tremella mesenterica]